MKTFTDKQGKEYEALNLKGAVIPVKADGEQAGDTYLIRPIQPEPKWQVFLDPKYNLIKIDCGPIDRDQAQLIKQSVESLMRYLTGDSDIDLQSLAKARAALEANNG